MIKILLMSLIMSIVACSFEPKELADGISILANDVVIKPVLKPEDSQCENDYECMALELGCCNGENTVGINRKAIFTLKRAVTHFCVAERLKAPDLCRGKNKAFIIGPKVQCEAKKCQLVK